MQVLVVEAQNAVRYDDVGRFGPFASLPWPGLEGALAEARRALDDPGAAGVIIETTAAT